MAVTAKILSILRNSGRGFDEAIKLARAMERGDDAYVVFKLVDELVALGATDEIIAIAACGLADSINAANYRERQPRTRDEFSEDKDSNRSRRGMPDAEWRRLRQEILERDNFACQYCGSGDDLTCDHVVPLVRGGTNERGNLTTACRPCNSSKGDRLLEEWRRVTA